MSAPVLEASLSIAFSFLEEEAQSIFHTLHLRVAKEAQDTGHAGSRPLCSILRELAGMEPEQVLACIELFESANQMRTYAFVTDSDAIVEEKKKDEADTAKGVPAKKDDEKAPIATAVPMPFAMPGKILDDVVAAVSNLQIEEDINDEDDYAAMEMPAQKKETAPFTTRARLPRAPEVSAQALAAFSKFQVRDGDERFEKSKGQKCQQIICDSCGYRGRRRTEMGIHTNGERMPREDRKMSWLSGKHDEYWFCKWCWASANKVSLETAEEELGIKKHWENRRLALELWASHGKRRAAASTWNNGLNGHNLHHGHNGHNDHTMANIHSAKMAPSPWSSGQTMATTCSPGQTMATTCGQTMVNPNTIMPPRLAAIGKPWPINQSHLTMGTMGYQWIDVNYRPPL